MGVGTKVLCGLIKDPRTSAIIRGAIPHRPGWAGGAGDTERRGLLLQPRCGRRLDGLKDELGRGFGLRHERDV